MVHSIVWVTSIRVKAVVGEVPDQWFGIFKHILIVGEDQNDKSLEATSLPTAGLVAKCSWWPHCNFERET